MRVRDWPTTAMRLFVWLCLGTILVVLPVHAQPPEAWFLPSPAPSLDPVQDRQQLQGMSQQLAQDPLTIQRLPPVVEQIPLPTPRVIPNAVSQFSPGRPAAQLIRGTQVLELSNDALRSSGLFDMAIESSPRLARSFQVYEARTLQRQQMEFQAQLHKLGQGPNVSAQEMTAAVGNARAAQQVAAEKFESELWDVGLNGAKVASVNSPTTSAGTAQRYVLVEAIGRTQSDNLGYATTRVSRNGQLGVTTVPSEYLLPLPQDANDLFFPQTTSESRQRAPDGMMVRLSDDFSRNPIVQALAAPRFGVFHDTGFVVDNGRRNFAENVSLMSRQATPAGQTFFVQDGENTTVPLDLGLNTQVMDIGAGKTAQFFLTADNDRVRDQLDVESLGVRAYNRQLGTLFEGWSLAVGTQQSLFGEVVFKPAGLDADRTLIGTVDRSKRLRPQLAVHAPLTNSLTFKIAIEEPTFDDVQFTQSSAITELARWPTLATNMTWTSEFDHQLHLGGLLRSYGFEENATGNESFATGWGLSAIAKINTGTSSNFIGVAGGNGVGDYIQGVRISALADTASIGTVSGLGLFVGRQTVFYDACRRPVAEFNAAYGYSLNEVPELLAPTFNRKLHQGWINYMRFIGDRVGVGFEYQYGYRRTGLGDVGEDHRFLLLVALRSAPTESSTRTTDYVEHRAPVAVTGAGGLDDDLPPPEPLDTGVQSSTATLGNRPLPDVVNQFQFGGPAHRQGL